MPGSDRDNGTEDVDRSGFVVFASMVAALLIVSGATSVFSSQPSASKADLQNAHSNGNHREASEGKPRQTTRLVAPIKAVSPSIKRPISSQDSGGGDQERQQKRRDLAAQESMARWAKVMGIAAVVTMFITGLGLWLLKRTVDETKRAAIAADAMVVEARKTTREAKSSTKEARKATAAAERSVRVTSAASERELRAYSFVHTVGCSPIAREPETAGSLGLIRAGRDYKLEFFASNLGSTPATNVKVKYNIRSNFDNCLEHAGSGWRSCGVIFPQQDILIEAEFTIVNGVDPKFWEFRGRVIFDGRIDYRDFTGEARWTLFSFWADCGPNAHPNDWKFINQSPTGNGEDYK